MSAKQQAVLDIKEELEKQGKCFIAFHSELNPAINQLVKEWIEASNKK